MHCHRSSYPQAWRHLECVLQGGIRRDPDEDLPENGRDGGQQGFGQSTSVFDTLNQKLKDAGLPPFNLGEHVIQPIVYVGFLVAFVLLGVKGLLFGLVLFIIVKLSSSNGGIGQVINSFFGGNTNRNNLPRSGGNRLGNNFRR